MAPIYDFDLITIGGGSGGVRASRIAAGHGARVAVVEEDGLGGTCVLRGCVPKKLLVYGSAFSSDFADAAGFGWHVTEPVHDWPALITAKNNELDRLAGIYQGLMDNAGVTVLHGRGKVTGAHEVTVDGKTWTAERILIAVGGWPLIPDIPGLREHAISSNEALDLAQRPDEIVILGSGYIAVEFAGIFAGFGVKTHLVFRADQPLRGFDTDMRQGLMTAMQDRGIMLHAGAFITSVHADAGLKTITLDNGAELHADVVMAATGRMPNIDGLGLSEQGVTLTDKNAIKVDDQGQSSVPSIYAIGDVTDRINLTPVAIAEGHIFADRFYGQHERRMDYENVPSAVFSQPPLATVGLTEEQAKDQGLSINVYAASFRAMKNTISGRNEKTLMKLIVDTADDKVIGVHMLGPDAAEIIQGIAIAIKAGATKADFDATIGIHPTAAEEFVTMRTARGE
ncbi:MAG: glutathione-disulfide reductase, partial [Candidatus Puniceispirillales bacterium]